jgi:membrane-associated HD superfamily phosphohydrolase
MNEEAKQTQETKITIWIISPLLVAAYVTTIVYAILACREWDTYSDFQKVTLVGLLIINVYMIVQIAYTLAKPESFLEHSKSRLHFVIQVILLCLAAMSIVVYFQNPEVYNLKVATGITALITICSIGIILSLMCVVVFMGACEYLYTMI